MAKKVETLKQRYKLKLFWPRFQMFLGYVVNLVWLTWDVYSG